MLVRLLGDEQRHTAPEEKERTRRLELLLQLVQLLLKRRPAARFSDSLDRKSVV